MGVCARLAHAPHAGDVIHYVIHCPVFQHRDFCDATGSKGLIFFSKLPFDQTKQCRMYLFSIITKYTEYLRNPWT